MEDYGRRDWELPCVCGHSKGYHGRVFNPYSQIEYCTKCAEASNNTYHDFKLDNLALIEQVARAKGLV